MIDMIVKFCDEKKVSKPKNLKKLKQDDLQHICKEFIRLDEYFHPRKINLWPFCLEKLFKNLNLNDTLGDLDKSTQILDLNHNEIGPEGAKIVAKHLISFPELTELELNNNQIGDDGLIAISAILPKLVKLRKLELGGENDIDDNGIIALSKALSFLPNLSILGINSNDWHKKGMIALTKVFPKLKNLQEVDLTAHWFDHEDVKILGKGLSCLQNLQILDLNSCNLNDKDIIFLAPILSKLNQLKKLSLEDNPIQKQGIMILKQKLKHIQKLYIDNIIESSEQQSTSESQEYQDGDEVCGLFEIEVEYGGRGFEWYLEEQLQDDKYNKYYKKWEKINELLNIHDVNQNDIDNYKVIGCFTYFNENWDPNDYVIIINNREELFNDIIMDIFENPKNFEKDYIIDLYNYIRGDSTVKDYILSSDDVIMKDLFKKILSDPLTNVKLLFEGTGWVGVALPQSGAVNTDCAICTEDFCADDREISQINCGHGPHAYHTQCLQGMQAAGGPRTCPVCRDPFTSRRAVRRRSATAGGGL
jgi:hypothetical protein